MMLERRLHRDCLKSHRNAILVFVTITIRTMAVSTRLADPGEVAGFKSRCTLYNKQG